MDDSTNLKGLLKELRLQIGSGRRLAQELGVTEKTLYEWQSRTNGQLLRLHPANVDAIISLATEHGLEPERFKVGPSLWEIGGNYDDNLELELPPPPRSKRPFLNHSIEFLGTRLNSPVGVGPCDLTATPARIKWCLDGGADLAAPKNGKSLEGPCTLPMVTWFCTHNQPMLEAPILDVPEVEVTLSTDRNQARSGVVGSFRRRSFAPAVWQAQFRESQQCQRPGQMVILPVNGTGGPGVSEQGYIDDWVRVCEFAASAGATVIQLDLTIPYETSAGPQLPAFCQPELAVKICKAVQTVVAGMKILLKIGYVVGADLRRLVLDTAGAGLCQGFAAINSPIVKAFHRCSLGNKTYLSATTALYLSGRPILGLGLQCVHELASTGDKAGLKGVGIIGTGGVTTEQDFMAYLHNGADVVFVTSALYFDSYFPFKLRKFYDAQAQRAGRVAEDEGDIALASFAKGARKLQTDAEADPAASKRIMGAALEAMVEWQQRKEHAASLGPLRPRPAPTLDECIRLIHKRLMQP